MHSAAVGGVHPAELVWAGANEGRPLSCLLVDDSKYDRQRVRLVCNRAKMAIEFTETADLDAAVTALRTHDYDFIMLDQMLPDGEGTTVAELFKNHLGHAAPPIVMISGSLDSAMPVRAKASGCASYIDKNDMSPSRMRDAIEKALAHTRHVPLRTAIPVDEHKQALRDFARDTAVELRSQLRIVLRLLAKTTDRHPMASSDLNEIRTVCDEIWQYLDVLGRIDAERRG